MGQLARREHVFRYPSANPRVTARFELARTVNRSLRVVKLLAGLPMPRSTRDTDSPHDPGWDASMGDLGAGEVPAGQVGRTGRIPEMTVLSYTEIPDDQAVKVIFTVEAQNKS